MENKNLMSFAEFYASAHVIGLDDEIKGVVGNEIAGTRDEESHNQDDANVELNDLIAEAIWEAYSHRSSIDEKLVMIPMEHHPVLVSVSVPISDRHEARTEGWEFDGYENGHFDCKFRGKAYHGMLTSPWICTKKKDSSPASASRLMELHEQAIDAALGLFKPKDEYKFYPNNIVYITMDGEFEPVAIDRAKEVLRTREARKPMYFDLKDKAVTKRVVRHAARRVIDQHQEEIEALAYK